MKDLTTVRYFTDEAKAELSAEQEKLQDVPDAQLIMQALAAILEEQYRTGHRSEGWPPLRDRAIQWELEERSS